MPAYEAFAGLYDVLMDDVDYDAWAAYYLALIARMGVEPWTLCDCACGTGSMSVRFAERGLKVTGVDLSGDMLELARQKVLSHGARVMFVRQDMCELTLPRPVDAIVCACDGVNYLLSDDQVRAFFTRARESLRPGGVLACDISSPYKLRHTLGNNFFGEDRGDIAYLWDNRWDEASRTVAMDLTFFTREPDGRYRRFEEQHMQRAHEPERLAELLAECGFCGVRMMGDRRFDPPAADEPRIHMAAIRE